ncbi:Protein RKD5 [Platanthera guangdongensis]|uniref:Protein RKD5 n=1 Tax=Platanthera guangdongensis TaxID=2320717 RepID=A0ABR2MWK0_9ASPA
MSATVRHEADFKSAPLPEGDANDYEDVFLRFLDLSPPPLPSPPPPLENELADAEFSMPDPSFWNFADERPSTSTTLEMAPLAGGSGDWVPPKLALDCKECVILREVVHSNGSKSMRLSIHGTVGRFYHATLDVSHYADGYSSVVVEHSYIDLREQSFEWVKQFLIDYGLLRLRDKYVMAHDSVSAFFDALCVRMSFGDLYFPAKTGLCQHRPSIINNGVSKIFKTGIAAQRERTGKLHIKDLSNYFHLPISEAAKELHICSTALKKICRKHGMPRWPHRKIKSIDRRISNLLRDFCADDGLEALNIQVEIEQLRAQRAKICAGLQP